MTSTSFKKANDRHYNPNDAEVGAEVWGRTAASGANVNLPLRMTESGGAPGTGIAHVHLESSSVSIGGGTQYTEGDTDSSITGNAFLFESKTNLNRLVTAQGHELGGSNALAVEIVDASGNQITSFGGGVQYTEGDTDASITGTAIMWEDTGNTLRAVSGSTPLPITEPSGLFTTMDASLAQISADMNSAAISLTLLDDVVYAEDSAHSSTNKGIFTLAVRNDAGTALAGDGDYIPLMVNSAGALYVTGGGAGTQYTEGDTDASITGTALMWEDTSDTLRAVSAAKPLPVIDTNSAAALTSLQLIDDTIGTIASAVPTKAVMIAGTDGANARLISVTTAGTISTQDVSARIDDNAFSIGSHRVFPLGGYLDDSSPDSVDEGDAGVVRMSANRNLYVRIRDNAGNERGLNVDAGGRIGVTLSDGTDVADIFDLTNSNPLAVAIVDASGDQIASFGGGTQYTEGDTDATIVGTAMLWEDTSDTLRAVSAAKPLPVNVVAGGTSGVQYTEGDTDASITGTALMFEGAANALVAAPGTAANGLLVDVSRVQGTVTASDTATLVDDAAFTPGTSRVMMFGAEFDDTTPDSVNEGDGGALRMSANRNLYFTLRDAAGNERGVNVNASNQLSTSVDNTVTVASHAVTNAGTFAVQVDGAALTALQLIDDMIYTDDTSTHATGTSKGALIMAAATPTDTAVNANDIGAVAMTVGRSLFVSVQDALPAGTNNIGDVDILSIVTGTGATNLGKAEDAGHTTGDVGVMALGVANTANANISGTTLDYTPFSTDLTGAMRSIGNVAHDAADAGDPLKIGSKATDYQPDTEDEQGATEVTAADRANLAMNLRGEIIEGVNSKYHLFDGSFPDTGLNGRYDDSPTSSTSESVEAWNYRKGAFGCTIDSTLTPTDITFELQASYDNSTWFKVTNGAWGKYIYDDTAVATAVSETYTFDVVYAFYRVKATATGTNSTNYFDVSNAHMVLRN